MIQALIIDDEQHCIDRLSMLLNNNYSDTIRVLDRCNSVEQGISAIKKHRPELVFLDIQIHDQTGFDLMQSTSEYNYEVIFTTAHDGFAVKAFKFSAVDYLLKPVDTDDLANAIEKVKSKQKTQEQSQKLDSLFYNLKNLQAPAKKICIPVSNGKEIISVSDIVRCQSDVNYTYLFLQNKTKIIVTKTLKEFDELLSDYNFFRVHNSHLVNLNYVKGYSAGKGGMVILTDGTSIDVSTRRKDEFLKRLEEM